MKTYEVLYWLQVYGVNDLFLRLFLYPKKYFENYSSGSASPV
jgi:hypothetical protein